MIGQDYDYFILEMIKFYYNSSNKITTDKPKHIYDIPHYRISMGGAELRKSVFSHFHKYPLLGHKLELYNK